MQKFGISSTYPEGALMRLATWLSSRNQLEHLWMPSRRVGRTAAALMALSARGRETSRRLARFGYLPETREVLPAMEIRRMVARTGLTSYDHFAETVRFDEYVASHLKGDIDILIGMPLASAATFRASRAANVFHEVNATPRHHNRQLLAYYPKTEVAHELHSDEYISRVEGELLSADAVLSPSSLVSRQLAEVGIDSDRIIQVPYGVDIELFGTPPDGFGRRREGVPRLLYVGQISRRKGIPFLVQAARATSFHLTLAGPIVEQELLAVLPENVDYVGTVSRHRLRELLWQHDAFVFPSIEDNFGLAVLEAASAGLPVITTTEVGSAEGLIDADIIQPGSVGELRESCSRVQPLSPDDQQSRALQFASMESDRGWDAYCEKVTAALIRKF
ncbi:glycosyltransferase family 4 protein [Cnuibacter physcomitrellae]|uniref:glycosyltransferase family 4 protein n=1 Tax=Cnuibacter physcomitrellae TaxID=1619308 RepID=UPI002175C70A|nr:glycosyltransferase family 4 protein [Cnuibacter physcomitrellae]MCS5496114.1 glycosyltransferase family 4 protein [Cnuibacter physcomitrellae]